MLPRKSRKLDKESGARNEDCSDSKSCPKESDQHPDGSALTVLSRRKGLRCQEAGSPLFWTFAVELSLVYNGFHKPPASFGLVGTEPNLLLIFLSICPFFF